MLLLIGNDLTLLGNKTINGVLMRCTQRVRAALLATATVTRIHVM